MYKSFGKNISVIIVLGLAIVCSPICFAQNEDLLPAAVVTAKVTPKALVRGAAKTFEKKHSISYSSEVEYIRSWGGLDQCCQFYYGRGLYIDQKFNRKVNKLYFNEKPIPELYLMEGYISAPIIPGSDEIMQQMSVMTDVVGYRAFQFSYSNNIESEILNRKRTLEAWGPLSLSHVDDFEDSILEDTGKGYLVSFKTKDGHFPNSTKMGGRGVIMISKDNYVSYVETDVFEDRYTYEIRTT